MIVGVVYNFKEYLKAKFPQIRYLDLIFGNTAKSAWVVPVIPETATLAEYIRSLGAEVEEVDLDEDEDENDDAEPDEDGLIDEEAEEARE